MSDKAKIPNNSSILEIKFNEHLNYLNKIYPYEESPFFKLLSSYKRVSEAVREMQKLLTDSLSDLFTSQKAEILNHFSEDIRFLMESGSLRKLEEGEISDILGLVSDLLDSIYSKIVRRMSNDLQRYLKWAPEAGDSGGDLLRECETHYMKLLSEIAKAKAERDVYKERAESLEKSVEMPLTGKYKILELLERAGRPMKPVEIASELDLSEVTVRKYVRELLIEGLLIKNDKVRPYTYSLGDPNWRAKLKARE